MNFKISLILFFIIIIIINLINDNFFTTKTKKSNQYTTELINQEELFRNRIKQFNNRVLSCDSGIDIIYTWVNGSDNKFLDKRKNRLNLTEIEINKSKERFRDIGLLKYSLRSIKKYANWVNNIWIITDEQIPDWFNQTFSTNIKFLYHKEFFNNKKDIPTFNSNSIEMNFKSLPNEISDCILYLNDDIFFRNPVYPDDFFHPTKGISIFQTKWDINAMKNNLTGKDEYQKTMYHTNQVLTEIWGMNSSVNRFAPDHGIQVMNRHILKKIYRSLGRDIDKCSSNPTRSSDIDLSLSFLNNQFTIKGFKYFIPKSLINYYHLLTNNIEKTKDFIEIVNNTDFKFKTICLNDGLESNSIDNELIISLILDYLNYLFPIPGNWEKV